MPTMSDEAYVAFDGMFCPKCRNHALEWRALTLTADGAAQKVSCLNCSASWHDILELKGFEIDEEGRIKSVSHTFKIKEIEDWSTGDEPLRWAIIDAAQRMLEIDNDPEWDEPEIIMTWSGEHVTVWFEIQKEKLHDTD